MGNLSDFVNLSVEIVKEVLFNTNTYRYEIPFNINNF